MHDEPVYDSGAGRWHPGFAGRLFRTVGALDVGISAFRGMSREPAFTVAADGTARLVPMPDLTTEQYLDCVRHPERYLTDETFLPGSTWGPRRLRFPFTVSVLGSLGHFQVRAWIRGEPRYLPVQAEVGDFAIFFRKAAVEITFENEKYLVVPQAAILGLVRQEGGGEEIPQEDDE